MNSKTSNPDEFEQTNFPIRILDFFLSNKSNYHHLTAVATAGVSVSER